jgi:hypothetical protein
MEPKPKPKLKFFYKKNMLPEEINQNQKNETKNERKKKRKRKEKHMARLGWAGLGRAGPGRKRPSDFATARAECEKQSAEKDRSYGVGFTPSALYG